jgi:hypothetical protein
MTVLESVRTFLLTYPGWVAGAAFSVDNLGNTPTQYGLMPLPSATIIERYIDGSTVRQFAFAIQSMESTADDLARIAASGFYETFATWLETQTDAGTLPTMATGKTAESIEALQSGFLYDYGESGVGIYQIQCRLTYKQDAI